MKKIVFLIVVVVTVFLVGCASSQTSTGSQVSTARTNTGISFEGFWETPDGHIFLFQNRAFIMLQPNGNLVYNGLVFNQTNSELTLHFLFNMNPMQLVIAYAPSSIDEVNVSRGGDSLVGIWKRRKDLNDDMTSKTSTIPFLGYWERQIENGMRDALHFLPWGWGFMYTFDQDYLMFGDDNRSVEITYNQESPTADFDFVSRIGDSASTITLRGQYNWEIDGNDLLITPLISGIRGAQQRFSRR